MTLGLHTLRNASVGELLSLLSHRRDDLEIDELCRRIEGLEEFERLSGETDLLQDDIEERQDRIDSLSGRLEATRHKLVDLRDAINQAISVTQGGAA